MFDRRSVLLGGAALLATPAITRAQGTWPSRPIRVVVASAAGGNADVVMRLMAPELERRLGQPIVVENLAAASGMQGTEAVARAAPDGHTLLVGTSSQLVFNMALFNPMPFDLAGMLKGAAMINKVPLVLLANPSEPGSMRDYVAKLRAAPGRYQYGSGPQGTTTHIVGLMWARAVGVDVQHVPYRAGSEGLRDLMAGRLSHQFDVAVTAIPHVQSRALKPLAVTSAARISALPDVPTVAEQGFPGFTGFTWNSIAVPSATPAPIVERINREVAAVLDTPAIRERLIGWGSELSAGMTPSQVDAFYAEERRIWIPLVRETQPPRS